MNIQTPVSQSGFYVLHFNVAYVKGSLDHVLSIVSPSFPTMFEADQFALSLPCINTQVIACDGQKWIQFIDILQSVVPECPYFHQTSLENVSDEDLDVWIEVVPVPYLKSLGYYGFRIVRQSHGVISIDCRKILSIGDMHEKEFEFSFIVR